MTELHVCLQYLLPCSFVSWKLMPWRCSCDSHRFPVAMMPSMPTGCSSVSLTPCWGDTWASSSDDTEILTPSQPQGFWVVSHDVFHPSPSFFTHTVSIPLSLALTLSLLHALSGKHLEHLCQEQKCKYFGYWEKYILEFNCHFFTVNVTFFYMEFVYIFDG